MLCFIMCLINLLIDGFVVVLIDVRIDGLIIIVLCYVNIILKIV